MKFIFMATFHEKTRRLSFTALCMSLLFATTLIIPRESGTMRALIINPNQYSQANNATWVSISIGLSMGLFLPLISAIFLRNTIHLDRSMGTMSLFLTTRFPKGKYVFGKFLCNICISLILWLIILLTSYVETVLKYGLAAINLEQFILPFLILIPGLVFVSAVTLATEVIPGLRGKLGTIALSVGITFLYTTTANYQTTPGFFQRLLNISGSTYLITNIKQAILASSNNPLSTLRVIGSTTSRYTGNQNLVFPPLQLTIIDLQNLGLLLLMSLILVSRLPGLIEKRPLIHTTLNQFLEDHSTISLPIHVLKLSRFRLSIRLLTAPIATVWLWLICFIWLWSWFATFDQLTHITFPLLYLAATPIVSSFGASETQENVYQWLATFQNGQLRQTLWSCTVEIVFSLGLILPLLIRSPSVSRLPLSFWAILLPLLAQLIGRTSKSTRLTQTIIIIFFYLYLNGAPLLPFGNNNHNLLTLIYATLTIIVFTILALSPKIKETL